jgi:hypothetical protein
MAAALTLKTADRRAPQKAAPVSQAPASTRLHVAGNYARLPLSFEPNGGQTGSQSVQFLSHGQGYTLLLEDDQAVLALRKRPSSSQQPAGRLPGKRAKDKRQMQQTVALQMKLLDGNPAARLTAVEELPGKTNYLIGNDPKKWRTNVPNYKKVKRQDVYPGIDLVYYGNQQELEYDFTLAAGADPDAIRLSFGPHPLHIAGNGDLVVALEDTEEVRWHQPVAYQLDGASRKRFVPASYVLEAAKTGPAVSFRLGAYDHNQPLVIDPTLAYSTFLGGAGDENDDSLPAIAVDLQGNAYVTGDTDSANFPLKNPFQSVHGSGYDSDAFVTKLSPDGSSLVYSTFLGGSGEDIGYSICVDLAGNVYLGGTTGSADFPVTPLAFQTTLKGVLTGGYGDGFVTKLSASGSSLVYSTYLGADGGVNYVDAIVVDRSGSAYAGGVTSSVGFPVTAGAFQTVFGGTGVKGFGDGFVSKLNPAGTALIYSTFLGGSGDEAVDGIDLDRLGNVYVAGSTSSANFPVTPNAVQTTFGGIGPYNFGDGFVTKLNATGSALVYSTYLGGASDELCVAIKLDGFGNAHVDGWTLSSNFPVTPGAYQTVFHGSGALVYGDGYITKLNTTGTKLIYSTYLGGSGDDFLGALAVDLLGNAYLTGFTNSKDYPVTAGAFQPAFAGAGPVGIGDAILTVLNPFGSAIKYSTYFGGSGDDYGAGIALDLAGNIYFTGDTASADFHVTPGAFQTTFGGSGPTGTGDAFVTKFTRRPQD